MRHALEEKNRHRQQEKNGIYFWTYRNNYNYLSN